MVPFMIDPTYSITMIIDEETPNDLEDYIPPGLVQGCYMIDTLRLSTLECFYADSDCFPKLFQAIDRLADSFDTPLPQVDVHPLRYNAALTRFPPRTLLSHIIEEMMIENWTVDESFDQYYSACRPNYCTYVHIQQNQHFLTVITSLISLVGGLTAALRILVPLLVKLLFFRSKSRAKPTRSGNLFSLVKLMPITTISSLQTDDHV